MRLSLERLDGRKLELELGALDQRVVVSSASELGGTLDHGPDRLQLSDVRARAVLLEALRLVFGSVVLTGGERIALTGVGLSLDQTAAHLALDLTSASLEATRLDVTVGSVSVGGNVTMSDVRLSLRDGEGRLEAKNVVFDEFHLTLGETRIRARAVAGTAVTIAWGAAGFELAASSIETSAAEVELSFTAAEAPEASDSAEPFVFDWRVLDGLSGDINADLALDLTVPILGRRQATHRFRVRVEHGSIDYRRLENDLSTLENTLLDFSVRDGALVLERGIPLLPTRGYGKPIVLWDLGPDDVVLAEQQRVRLAVLPRMRMAREPDARVDESPPSVALRRLGVHVDASVALAPIRTEIVGPLRLRSVGSLSVRGNVSHDTERAPLDGSLRAEAVDVEAALDALSLAALSLDVGRLQFARASSEIAFTGVRPRHVHATVDALSLKAFALGSRRSGAG